MSVLVVQTSGSVDGGSLIYWEVLAGVCFIAAGCYWLIVKRERSGQARDAKLRVYRRSLVGLVAVGFLCLLRVLIFYV